MSLSPFLLDLISLVQERMRKYLTFYNNGKGEPQGQKGGGKRGKSDEGGNEKDRESFSTVSPKCK